MINNNETTARLETIEQLLENTVPLFLSPPPKKEALKAWLDDAKVPRFKANPTAERGGGTVWYSVAGVEKFFRNRMMPGKTKRTASTLP